MVAAAGKFAAARESYRLAVERDPANPAVTASNCPAQPASIPVGGTFSCSFAAYVAGDADGPDHVNTAVAAVTGASRWRWRLSNRLACSVGFSWMATARTTWM